MKKVKDIENNIKHELKSSNLEFTDVPTPHSTEKNKKVHAFKRGNLKIQATNVFSGWENWDVMLCPMVSDGPDGLFFQNIIESLQMGSSEIMMAEASQKGYDHYTQIFDNGSSKTVILVYVDSTTTKLEDVVRGNVVKALTELTNNVIGRSIWIPAMATGKERLSNRRSINAIVDAITQVFSPSIEKPTKFWIAIEGIGKSFEDDAKFAMDRVRQLMNERHEHNVWSCEFFDVEISNNIIPSECDVAITAYEDNEMSEYVLNEMGYDPKREIELTHGDVRGRIIVTGKKPVIILKTQSKHEVGPQVLKNHLRRALTKNKEQLVGKQVFLPLLGIETEDLTEDDVISAESEAIMEALFGGQPSICRFMLFTNQKGKAFEGFIEKARVAFNKLYQKNETESVTVEDKVKKNELDVKRGGISLYSNDGPESGRDRLNFKQQVEALAKLIAYKNLKPPLAVGLFGHWGAGKTFFMRYLRDRIQLCEESGRRARQIDGETAFCQRIAKIHFNAWHYVDTDLMASLVAHIFDELAEYTEPKKDTIASKRSALFEKLENKSDEQRKLKQALSEANKNKKELEYELEKAKEDVEDNKEEIVRLTDGDTLDKALARKETAEYLEKMREKIDESTKELGLNIAIDTVRDAMAVYKDFDKTYSQAKLVAKRFTTLRPNWKVFSFIAVLGLSPIFAWVINVWLKEGGLELITAAGAIVTGLVSKLGIAIHSVGKASKKVDEQLKLIQKAIDEANKKSEKDLLRPIEIRLEHAKEKEKKISEEINETKQEINRLNNALEELSVGRRMLRFIKDRAECQDYKRHLGLPAIVRKDFEALENLFKEKRAERKRIHKEKKKKGGSGRNESENDKYAIDRIVLFVDDLDRCPSECVVKVLETIHLLLAFDLFVVVVAVDPRWLQRSLSKHYPDLLASMHYNTERAQERKEASIPASPQDYLEKIFQIPVSVRAMDEEGYKKLITFMIKEAQQSTEVESTQSTSEEKEKIPHHLPEPVTGQMQKRRFIDKIPVDESSITDEKLNPSAQTSTTMSTISELEEKSIHATEGGIFRDREGDFPEPNPYVLGVNNNEVDALGKLYPFIRTPRSAKRLVNLYLLLKASINENVFEKFQNGNPAGYLVCMMILAAQVGYPRETELLQRILGSWRKEFESWTELLNCLRSMDVETLKTGHIKESTNKEVEKQMKEMRHQVSSKFYVLIDCIKKMTKEYFENADFEPKHFQYWARLVRRYSFYSYLEPEEEILFEQE